MTDTDRPTPIALITGGSRGLGRSMALHLADRGTDVELTYRANEAEARNVVEHITQKGRRALALPLDVGASATFTAFVEQGYLAREDGKLRLAESFATPGALGAVEGKVLGFLPDARRRARESE